MKTPRAALLVALLAVASTARAEFTTSLKGWTAFKALHVANPANPTSGAAYEDGVVYCDVGSPTAPKFPQSTTPFLPAYDCVVIGRPRTQAGPKVGGLFFRGKSYQQKTPLPKGPVISAPGTPLQNWIMLLRIDEKRAPYAPRTVILTAGTPAEQSQFAAYVEGGDHLNVVPGVPGSGPSRPGSGAELLYWCNPKDGKVVQSTAKKASKSWILLKSKNSPCAKGQAPVVVAPKPPVAPEGSLALSAAELIWLDKSQASLYKTKMPAKGAAAAAVKAHIDANRKLVAENLEPNAAAIAKYKAAAADPKAAEKTIDAALPPEVWGGNNNKTIVGLSGDRLEVQLSKAELEALGKLPAAAAGGETPVQAYARARSFASGEGKGPGYFADSYDPIVLHRTAEAARKLLPKAPAAPVVTKPEGDAAVAPLTKDEIALLTPKEKQTYEKLLDNVAKKQPGAEKALRDETDRLRKLIVSEGRGKKPDYVAPKNLEEFKKLPDHQKDIFCDPKVAGRAEMASGPTTCEPKLNTGQALSTLKEDAAKCEAEKLAAKEKAASVAADSSLPDWAKEPCALHLARRTPSGGNGNGNNGNTSNIGGKIQNGPDAVGKEKEGNKWLTKPLITTGIKGGLIGLLIGSLFGPIGLIAGPLIGAAIFYGMQKYNEIKEEKEKNKPE